MLFMLCMTCDDNKVSCILLLYAVALAVYVVVVVDLLVSFPNLYNSPVFDADDICEKLIFLFSVWGKLRSVAMAANQSLMADLYTGSNFNINITFPISLVFLYLYLCTTQRSNQI